MPYGHARRKRVTAQLSDVEQVAGCFKPFITPVVRTGWPRHNANCLILWLPVHWCSHRRALRPIYTVRCIARLITRSIGRCISYAFTRIRLSARFVQFRFVRSACCRDDCLDVHSNTDRATKNQARTGDLRCIARGVGRSNWPVYTVRSGRFRSIGRSIARCIAPCKWAFN